jgi:ribonuclease HII
VVSSCYIDPGVFIEGINDSKQTKEEERDAMYEVLIKHPGVHYATSIVSHTEIDEVNILQATMNGMRRSASELSQKLATLAPKSKVLALVDGNRVPTDMPVDAQYVIKGDGSIFSIAAASIIAKVTRDRIMVELDKKFPMYDLAQHKGYPTFTHRSLLLKHGPCCIHRASYGPVKLAMQAHGVTSLLDLPGADGASTGTGTTAAATSATSATTSVPVGGKARKASIKVVSTAVSKGVAVPGKAGRGKKQPVAKAAPPVPVPVLPACVSLGVGPTARAARATRRTAATMDGVVDTKKVAAAAAAAAAVTVTARASKAAHTTIGAKAAKEVVKKEDSGSVGKVVGKGASKRKGVSTVWEEKGKGLNDVDSSMALPPKKKARGEEKKQDPIDAVASSAPVKKIAGVRAKQRKSASIKPVDDNAAENKPSKEKVSKTGRSKPAAMK